MKMNINSQASNDRAKEQGSAKAGTKTGVATQLMELFENELKEIYWAEKALLKAIPKMINNATSAQLVDALDGHLHETVNHVKRLDEIFELFGMEPLAEKCEAITGLIKEGEHTMQTCFKGAVRDAGIIASIQKIEHFEIASYGTLCSFSKILGYSEAVMLLGKTLHEEKNADSGFTSIAESLINIQAI